MPEAKEVVVFLPNWVGDVVMATPALAALREHFAQARLTFVGRPGALETLAGSGLCDEQIVDPSKQRPRLRKWMALAREIRRRRFDHAILLPNSFRSAALAWVGGAKRISGYDRDLRGWMLTDKLRPRRDARGRFVPVPAIDYYNALAERLGTGLAGRRMRLAVRDEDARTADGLLAEAGHDPSHPLVMLNPGAAFGVSKMWRRERYAELGELLARRRGAQIIVNAAPSEKALAADVVAAMGSPPLLDFSARDNTLGLLKGLLRRCDLLVTNDTGARHLAAALGIGVVTLFGSTDPQWAAIDYDRERIVRRAVSCSPCQKRICPQPPGPLYHQCMQSLTVEMAMRAAEEVLDLVRPAARAGGQS
ncbi:MAG: ADP-heptose--LPS heptosyltransferase 2 [Planctomycetes bacterium ADurb.Bin126]|nr:MAG: ADP-heptose--LPS heptosyltransferase 2 [Planctomycetes bacterium ADurb.Bin126]HOD81504.1 lipopolysaccharide heptosyltransferase II [Phycisphaerae bacterium]HQL74012.1 lipopolysaccharide heptosyltransferase II [Phycisphaerae bacterium]